MRNYCYKVSKNGWRSQDKVDTITGINLYEIDRTRKSSEMCARGVMCEVYESSSYYEEYDAFYFQANNAVEAAKIGYEHYIKRDLAKEGKYNIFLYWEDKSISFNDAMSLSEQDAYELWKNCCK